jgi:predicted nucleotidyltransferase
MFIDQTNLKIITTILQKYVPEYEIRVFGSRVHGNNLKKFSDIDLVIMADKSLSPALYNNLKDAFSESDLPFRVDIAIWADIDASFQEIINNDYIAIQNKKGR